MDNSSVAAIKAIETQVEQILASKTDRLATLQESFNIKQAQVSEQINEQLQAFQAAQQQVLADAEQQGRQAQVRERDQLCQQLTASVQQREEQLVDMIIEEVLQRYGNR